MPESIDTADMRALAIVEENSHVLYRMVKQACDEIDRLRAKLEAAKAHAHAMVDGMGTSYDYYGVSADQIFDMRDLLDD